MSNESFRTSQIQLRATVYEDAGIVFQWRNDPFIVGLSSYQKTVYWEEHLAWFEETISSDNQRMFIIEKETQPIGQVRFDRSGEYFCTISIYLLQKFTGNKYGIEAIRGGCQNIFNTWNVYEVISCVRLDNNNACSAFLKAGFEYKEQAGGLCPESHFTFSLCRTDFF